MPRPDAALDKNPPWPPRYLSPCSEGPSPAKSVIFPNASTVSGLDRPFESDYIMNDRSFFNPLGLK